MTTIASDGSISLPLSAPVSIFVVHAYCQMGNHYHLMVETLEGNLSQGMRQPNAFYSQEFNRQHGLVGHVFQGRYKAILVQKESYLLELARYVVLNPVRAGMVDAPGDWEWGSYNFTTGAMDAPPWLDIVWLLSQFGQVRDLAIGEFRQFVLAGVGKDSPLKDTRY
jgi:putative transposase